MSRNINNPGIKPRSPALQVDYLLAEPPGKPRYEDDTTPMAKSEEELKSLMMRVKEENKNAGLKCNIQKLISWHPVPSYNGK